MPTTRTTAVVVVEEETDDDGACCAVLCIIVCIVTMIAGLIGILLQIYFAYLLTIIPIVYAFHSCYKARKNNVQVDWVSLCCVVCWPYNILQKALGAGDKELSREHLCCCPAFNPFDCCVTPDPEAVRQQEEDRRLQEETERQQAEESRQQDADRRLQEEVKRQRLLNEEQERHRQQTMPNQVPMMVQVNVNPNQPMVQQPSMTPVAGMGAQPPPAAGMGAPPPPPPAEGMYAPPPYQAQYQNPPPALEKY